MTTSEIIQQVIEAKVAEHGIKIGDTVNMRKLVKSNQYNTYGMNTKPGELLPFNTPDNDVIISRIILSNSQTINQPRNGAIMIICHTFNKDGKPSKKEQYCGYILLD